MPDCHKFPIRIYYEDTDSGGIVYYANYLRFAERARSEMLREIGIESSSLMVNEGVALAVRRCNVDYYKPARLDDLLNVETRLMALGGASIELEQIIVREGQKLVRLELKLACMAMDGRPSRLPSRLRDNLEPYSADIDVSKEQG